MPGTDTYLGLRAFVDELVRCGVRDACTSPGSRSTPLALSLARDGRLRATSHIDERDAAFFALGLAKTTGVPAVLACTSGTAAANYAPAVIEAREARVPLLVLTADRPPELRDVGAGQTIDQLKLYGAAVKWFADVDDHPASAARVRWLRQLACRAFYTALEGRPGPVHLNFALREPLIPDEPELPDDALFAGRAGGRAWVNRPRTLHLPGELLLEGLVEQLREHKRPILVAGRSERDPRLPELLRQFAERSGVPLLAEPTSGARRGECAIAHYDALLRDPAWASAQRPDLVLRVGDLPTSKPLRAWLASLDALQLSFDAEYAWQDPAGVVGTIVASDPYATFEALNRVAPRRRRNMPWLEAWLEADEAAKHAIARTVGPTGLTEPRVAAELGTLLPPEATLVVAASMPIRDVETFFPVRDSPPRVLANRGANGIDGTVATAFGVAAATAGPTVLLLGDVALAHDIGGLLTAKRLGIKLTLVVIDNDGGGIFHFLPVASQRDAFVEHVATPHGLDFAHAAELYGIGYERAADVDQFRAALARAIAAETTTMIVVRTEREANAALHDRVWEAVASR